jgi:hypothetical protein
MNKKEHEEHCKIYYQEHKEKWKLTPEKREYIKQWYRNNKPRVQTYMREYYQRNKNKLLGRALNYRSKLDKEKQQKYMKKYYKKNRERFNEKSFEYYHTKPKTKMKYRARELAQKKYPILSICQVCGEAPAMNRHHPNYKKPLKVIFCCRRCHKKIHRKYNPLVLK